MTAMEYGYLFKDAPDLEEFGAALVHKLEPLVAAGPPGSAEALKDRLVVEELVGIFIKRSRDRDFAFVRVPGLVHLFKAFTDQNVAAEKAAERRAWTARHNPVATFDAPQSLGADPAPLVAALAADGKGKAPQTGPHFDELLNKILEKIDHIGLASKEPESKAQIVEDVRLSEAVTRFLASEEERRGSSKSDALMGPVARFLVEFLGDKTLSVITADDLTRLDKALTEIPGIKGFSMDMRASLHGRYLHAQKEGWERLQRASTTTVELRYRRPLKKLFEWLKEKNLYAGPEPKFRASSEELLAVLPRDRFEDDELLRFVSAPLFTGCASRKHFWQSGGYFYQGDLYWIFLILMFTGMRTGEPPQIKLDDFVSLTETSDDGRVEVFHFIDMRPYNPAKGRKPIRELKHLKRSDFARVVPVHRLLIELGLLRRIAELRAQGETRLFPGWEAHTSAADEVRWGKDISRAFDYGRSLAQVDLTRANISVYALRHLLADWLDSASTPQRLRNRVLGHLHKAENAADEYGGKGLPDAEQARMVVNLDSSVIRKIRETLVGAKRRAERGELTMLNPF